MTVSSAPGRNRNTNYLKTEEPINDKNNKTTRVNVAREDKFVCLIRKKPGPATENSFHLSKVQEAVPNE